MRKTEPETWIIFCHVIDNFGDAGVCWRLAQQLAFEFNLTVVLVIDRPELLEGFGTNYTELVNDPAAPSFWCSTANGSLRVIDWPSFAETSFDNQNIPTVTVAAFACQLPANYRKALAAQLSNHLRWFNLEYLSAEPWINDTHLLNSTKPDDGLVETFYFPGFSPDAGGLIRERFWEKREELTEPIADLFKEHAHRFKVSLFCYSQAPVSELLNWLLEFAPIKQSGITLILTAGVPVEFREWLLKELKLFEDDLIKVEVLPWLSQREYDCLLASCEFNCVRGEDSWVRAIWARKPFVWQAYPQDLVTLQSKVEAWMDQLTQEQDLKTGAIVRQIHQLWNSLTQTQSNWSAEDSSEWKAIEKIYQNSCDRLSRNPDLASQLFSASRKI